MRAVIQRVTSASVEVGKSRIASIGAGIVILLGIYDKDTDRDADDLAEKLLNLRIFNDDTGRMNRSIHDISGSVLLVSQFTLCADTRKGRRPSFMPAKEPVQAERMYLGVAERMRSAGLTVQTGRFGATMAVKLVNDGPVTFVVDVPAAD